MKHGNIELLNMDCMELLKQTPDKFYELAIVDPPYGIGDFTRTTSRRKPVNRNYKRADWNESVPTAEYFTELRRVSHHQIIWGANYYNCFDSGGTLIWDKGNEHPDMSSCEVASTSMIRTVQRLKFFYAGFTEERIHPCQKPVEVYNWCLSFAKPGDKILDTHAGSFSIGIACHDYGFSLTATELDKDYYEAACKRFRNHVAQQKLFV